ncbi:hypothetical protein M431DRAFT_513449 [Trichoderma harzianum CBS 226.95]|uniref:Uncharacterized protein n=1 Tax=Trichoderma harzianum CBS 226.95 TaxID=983964 RepID=A0A2T3ZV12_TRIHA|nr:hypothetical protein M431DRAFT_513449 [Trichoderma harzianum CBS 226.95]PTB48646.1 hypothetical protein M431DRAFT_513449 [Trichoderma harzianum CBS 226.95]
MLVVHSPAHIIQWPPYRHSMVLPTPPPPPFTSSNQDLPTFQYQSHFEKLPLCSLLKFADTTANPHRSSTLARPLARFWYSSFALAGIFACFPTVYVVG